MNRKTVKKMAEQRLIDANIMAEDESEAYISAQTSGKISPITQGLNSVVHRKIQQLIADTPTIDPESLPVVRRLRKQVQTLQKELRDWDFWYGPIREQEAKTIRENRAAVKVTRKRCEKIIAELRTELSRVTSERDAAVNDLLHAGQGNDFCLYCVHCCVNGNTKYRPHETYMEFCKKCDDDYSQFEWRGLHKEE